MNTVAEYVYYTGISTAKSHSSVPFKVASLIPAPITTSVGFNNAFRW